MAYAYLRFINLCNEDALFATETPKTDIPLPFDDDDWTHSVGTMKDLG